MEICDFKCAIVFTSVIFTLTKSVVQGDLVGDDLKPVLVQILFRHGDRSATESYPSNPYNESNWPQGFGQLSKRGMVQHYKLGQYFRDRYINGNPFHLLNESYRRTEVYVRSTDRDRTLMSAYSHLAGMFPPNGSQVWNKDIRWQPIPVHTVPRENETLLDADSLDKCPEFDKSWNKTMHSDFVKQEEIANKEFYRFVANKTGCKEENLNDIWAVYDTLFCESQHPEHGFQLPAWANTTIQGQTVFSKLRELNTLEFDLKYNNTVRRRLSGGNLVGLMTNNMRHAIDSFSPKKYFIFSAHDTTVAALTSALGVYNGRAPPYATAVITELLQYEGTQTYYVRVLYKNESEHEPYTLKIPGCPVLCPFSDFVNLTKGVVPEDWAAECGITKPGGLSHLDIIVIISAITAVVLITIIMVTVAIWIRKQTRDGYGRYSSINSDA